MDTREENLNRLAHEVEVLRARLAQLEQSEVERKRAETAREETEKRFWELFDEAPVAYHELDTEGRITRVNRTEMEMLGYSKEEMVGRPIWEFVRERETARQAVIAKLAGSIPPGRALERTYVRKDGTTVPVLIEDRLLLDQSGRIVGIRSTMQDISERKRAERVLKEYSERLEEMVEERARQLQHAQEKLIRQERLAVLGELAGGVGHELRNPLGVISNAVYFLRMTLKDTNEVTREYLDIISSELHNAEKIVSDLLHMSRTKMPEKEKVNVGDIIRRTMERHPAPENVAVSIDLPAEPIPVFVDPRHLGQVLVNLVSNACQAMPEGGKLIIGARSDEKDVRIFITDTGHGIPKENISKIFEPLFTTKAKGIGLGLSVTKNLVEVNGGTIQVQSEQGKGSTFTVTFPGKEIEA